MINNNPTTEEKEKILIVKIDEIINNHLQNCEFDYDLLRKLMGVSTSKLYTTVRKERSDTPGKYILKRRLDEAMKLLTHSNLSIEQICLRTGFKDYVSFLLSFKGRFVKTPEHFISTRNSDNL